MKRLLVLCAATVALAGCQTQRLEEMNYAQQKQLANEIAKRCLAQGVRPNTVEAQNCFIVEVNAEQAKRARNRQALRDSGDALIAASAQSQPRQPIICNTTRGFGGASTTICN